MDKMDELLRKIAESRANLPKVASFEERLNRLLKSEASPEDLLKEYRIEVEDLWSLGYFPFNKGGQGEIYTDLDFMFFKRLFEDKDFNLLSDCGERWVLDAGSGRGTSHAIFLNELGAKIIALDVSFNAISDSLVFDYNYHMNQKVCGDFFQMPFSDESISFVVAYYFMADNPLFIRSDKDKEDSFSKFIQETHRVLVKDGIFIAKDPRFGRKDFEYCQNLFSYVYDYPCAIGAKK